MLKNTVSRQRTARFVLLLVAAVIPMAVAQSSESPKSEDRPDAPAREQSAPADPEQRGRCPIHQFDPEVLRTVQSAEVRTRTYWFDPQTHRIVQRQCGCDPAKYEVKVDYPPPESMSRGLFSFRIPSNARLEVADPELGRPLESEGQTTGD